MQKLRISVEWTAAPIAFDIDIAAFMLANDKYIPHEEYMVYYHNPISKDGSVKHLGDEQKGGLGEIMEIDLNQTAAEIEEIYIVITIYDAITRNQTFGKLPQAQVRITDMETEKVLNSYNLTTSFAQECAIELGRLFVRNGRWRWETLSVGYREGLEKFVNKYVF